MVFPLRVVFPSIAERTVTPKPLSAFKAGEYLYRVTRVNRPSIIGQEGAIGGRYYPDTIRGVLREAVTRNPL